jgi:UDP-N-acetyl-D-mannosaminuronic acid dehydrogenase
MRIVVVGGCGHVGLPLSVALAIKKHHVIAFDRSKTAVDLVNEGSAPFWEPGLS